MNEESIAITLLVVEVLEELGINYLISGSLASSVYGEARSTRDADILADIKHETVAPFCRMLEADFYVSEEAIRSALKHRSSFNLIHFQSVFKVDIFVPSRSFDQQELRRRSIVEFTNNPKCRAYVASPEDVILSKLDWYRKGNEVSNQQWRDVVGIFKANHSQVDREYLQQTAKDLQVLDLLQRLISVDGD